MKKKIILFFLFILNLFTINTFAYEYDTSYTGDVNNTSQNTSSTNKNNTSNGGGATLPSNQGSYSNPIPTYLTSADFVGTSVQSYLYDSYIVWHGGYPEKGGSWGVPAYYDSSIYQGSDGYYYKSYLPTYIVNKNETFRDIKTNYEVDYYLWEHISGPSAPQNWSGNSQTTKTKSTKVVFSQVGTYVLRVTPHEVTTRQKWKEYNNSFYIKYGNGHTTWIAGNTSSSDRETYTVPKLRTDIAEYKRFEIGPEEIGIEIDPGTRGEDLAKPELEAVLIE